MTATAGWRQDKLACGAGLLLLGWVVGLIFLAEPSPLKTPDSVVDTFQSLFRLTEPQARIMATVFLRGVGVGMIGILLALALRPLPLRTAIPTVLVLAAIVALGVRWIQYGYFPIRTQVLLILLAAGFGALIGLSLRHRALAITTVALAMVVALAWGMPKQVGDDLDAAARSTGVYLLSRADEISRGDQAFGELLQMAFGFAEDNSHGDDPILANQAAILALGVILGDEKIAGLGGRKLDSGSHDQRNALRQRVTAHGRADLPRHFWVSAALTVLSGEEQALAIGIGKEMADSLPGGSGFSFADMAANKAGIRLAVRATQDRISARRFQYRLLNPLPTEAFIPAITELPEGLSLADFQADYGGLGGTGTRAQFQEIDRRLESCFGLQ